MKGVFLGDARAERAQILNISFPLAASPIEAISRRRTFTARPPRMTEMVSPSETPTTFPVKVSLAKTVLTQANWKSAACVEKKADGNKKIHRERRSLSVSFLITQY